MQVFPARTELNHKRNTHLRDAKKAVEETGLAKDKAVEMKFRNDRQVIVGGDVVYQQARWGVEGFLQGASKYLSL